MPEITGRLRTPRLAAAPSSPVVGEIYYDTTTNVLLWWNGTAWVSAAIDPLAHGIRVWRSAAHPLTAGANNRIFFDSEDWDPSNNHTEATGYTAPATGLWAWASALALNAPAITTRFTVMLFVNGVERDRGGDITTAAAGDHSVHGSGFVRLNSGDIATIYLYVSAANNGLATALQQSRNWFELARLK